MADQVKDHMGLYTNGALEMKPTPLENPWCPLMPRVQAIHTWMVSLVGLLAAGIDGFTNTVGNTIGSRNGMEDPNGEPQLQKILQDGEPNGFRWQKNI